MPRAMEPAAHSNEPLLSWKGGPLLGQAIVVGASSGMGAAIVRELVELHGGTIGAESVYGGGSTFWFILPLDGPIRQPG